MEFSSSKNANWTDDSTGSASILSGTPENAGQRQEESIGFERAHPSGDPVDAGQRQGRLCPFDVEGASGATENSVLRRYTFKLYPNKAQAAAMQRQAALLAQLWNAALEQREIQYAREIEAKGNWHKVVRQKEDKPSGLSYFDQAREIKHIRAADPEFAAMSASSPELCLQALDDAFRAFFRRAKGGAGKSSGYPKYKSPYAIENKGADCTVWHRDAPKGWRMARAGKHFRVHAHGITGLKDRSSWLKARGRFPVDLEKVEVRDMRLIRVGGIWQCSIVVKMGARRTKIATAPHGTVEFDLIDEFASVKIGADGQCLPGWADEFIASNEQITKPVQLVAEASDAAASESGGNRRPGLPGAGRPWDADDAQSDAIQSEGDRRFKKFSYRWKQQKRRVAKRKAKAARQRKEALHVWTTRLVAGVSGLTAVCPPIKEHTTSARGDEKNHGAAVKTVAILNRHVLAQAPAMAIQMLEYKSVEAGIPFARITPSEHALAIGRDLPMATKAARKARRILEKEA